MKSISGPVLALKQVTLDDDALNGTQGNNDGIVNPGELIGLNFRVQNVGRKTAQNVNATLSLSANDPAVTIIQNASALGTLVPSAEVTNPSQYLVKISPTATTPKKLTFTLKETDSNGNTWSENLEYTVNTSRKVSGKIVKSIDLSPISGTIYYSGPVSGTVKNNSDGTYSLVVPSGTYTLVAKADGFLSSNQIQMTVSQNISNIDFNLLPAPNLRQVNHLSAFNISCYASPGGKIWRWGDSDSSLLGYGYVPSPILDLENILSVATASQVLALQANGSVWAWGANDYGQLGDSTDISRDSPAVVKNLSDAVAVAAGIYHSMALKSDGTVWTWGLNEFGQLGNGTHNTIYVALPVAGLKDMVAIAAGQQHSLALKSDGTVWMWGNDGSYSIDALTPFQVPNLSGIVAISAGIEFSLALKWDGTVWAWGSNWYGELGNGTSNAGNKIPTQISGLTKIRSIAAGGYHSFALQTDGTLWAWGSNDQGEIGDGTTISRLVPVKIAQSSSNIKEIAAGGFHSIALQFDGTLWAWGGNWNGQLGDGTTNPHLTPFQITKIPNADPIITLTSPATGSTFVAPATIPLKATSSSKNGFITKVEFYNGNTKIGESTTAPYNFTWNYDEPGDYILKAKAIDALGVATFSEGLNVYIKPATPSQPTLRASIAIGTRVALTWIDNHTRSNRCDAFTVERKTGLNGTYAVIARKERDPFYNTLNDFHDDYTLDPLTTYFYRVRAFNQGGSSLYSNEVSITTRENAIPDVWVNSPASGTIFTAPANIFITGNATDPDGKISKIEIYAGNTKIGENPLYYTPLWATSSMTWNNVPVGNYSLTLKATDNHGASVISVAKNIQVVPPTNTPLPNGWTGQILGSAMSNSGSSYNPLTGTYSLTATGRIGSGIGDNFNFAYMPWTGNGQIVARITSFQDVGVFTRAGIMMRENLTTDSKSVFLGMCRKNMWIRRLLAGGLNISTLDDVSSTVPQWFKLVRYNNSITGFYSTDTTHWTFFETETLDLPSTIYVGLAVASGTTPSSTSTFDNVSIQNAPANNLPTITLSSPQAGMTLKAPANVTLNANALDSNDKIIQVSFHQNGQLIGTDETAPYSFSTLSALSAGTYTFTTKATDESGATVASNPITINVVP